MTADEQKILRNFEKLIPKLNNEEKNRLLGFGEGMLFKEAEKSKKKETQH